MAKISEVYQFKITLKNSNPPIWRRIVVPSNYNFWDLHVAITDVMGWQDYHLHEFEIIDPANGIKVNIGMNAGEFLDEDLIEDHKVKISKYFSKENSKAKYTYDFGDEWEHSIKFEKSFPSIKNEKYPKCTAGKMACPPEDCGGLYGYYNILNILKDPKHKEYEEFAEWLDPNFDPEYFNYEEVIFNNPKERIQ